MNRAKRDRLTSLRVIEDSRGGPNGHAPPHLNTQAELRTTLRSRSLDIVYQPIISLLSGRIVGMEALARWTTPSGTTVSPDVFIPMAEESGLIDELGSQIMAMAVHDAASWQRIAATSVRVNVSPVELRARGFYDATMRTIDRAGLDAHLLGLELPESVLLDPDEDTCETLRELRAAGVSLMLDDLGDGYTSLDYLFELPVVDKIKIDRSFLNNHRAVSDVVQQVLDLGRAHGLQVCVEGVENAAQHALVRELSCDFAQGYYFARPISREMVPQMLRDWAPFLPA